ncbi:MAG: molybdate ABC transporter substrate-binding protein [Oscillospiraceae bacterium]
MKKLLSLFTAVALSAALLTACGSGDSKADSGGTSKLSGVTLNVFAAASMTESLTKIQSLYKTAAPDVTLQFNFDSSGTLQTQIEQGAQADLFISAAQKQMDALATGKYLLDGTRADILQNKVVLVVPTGSTAGIASFDDILTDKVKIIALGNSDVPVGQYAEKLFTKLGTWDQVKAKATLGTNVKEVLSAVASASADCGVVYATDAITEPDVTVAAQAPADADSVIYPAAVLAQTANADAAKAFLAYLKTDAAKKIFTDNGFVIPQ